MKKILITGIPGMGKTTLGHKLKDVYNFEHIEMETNPEEHSNLVSNEEAFFSKISNTPKDFVITWGFYPPNSTAKILFLKGKGFNLIWLDGNRQAALREYTKRCKRYDPQHIELHLEAFHKQILRIDYNKVVEEISPIKVNTFNETGRFRKIDEIINEIFVKIPIA